MSTGATSILYSSDGYEVAVSGGSANSANNRAVPVAGSDGTNNRLITLDTSGRQIVVGAGTAGTPAGGVISIQGVASGTVVPISGTVTATQSTAANLLANVGGLGAAGAAVSGNPVRIGGSDGTNTRDILLDSSGRLITIGAAANGAAVAGNPVLVAGSDGTNARTLKTANDGTLNISGAVTVTSGSIVVTQSTAANLLATVTQGPANTLANAWPIKLTDGTNTMPTMDVAARRGFITITDGTNTMPTGDAVGRAIFEKITDGTNTAAVKAASTAAVAADPSLVVGLSPNSPLPTGSNTIGVVNQGTAATLANAWSTKITDATNGPVAVKASSTSPLVTDQALVVVISPNQQPIPVEAAAANATTGVSFGRVVYGSSSQAFTAVRATAYTEQTTNFTGSVKSASASDTSAGTGARTVIITYYDQTGAGPFTETVTLNGTTAVNLVNTNHCFIEKMAVVTVGSNATNVGVISLFTGAGGTGTTVGSIGTGNIGSGRGDNSTLWAHHYTPTGKTTSIYLINAGTTGNQNADLALYSIPVLTANAAEVKISDSIVSASNSDSISRNSANPIKVTGFARTTMYVISNGANQPYTGGFDYSDQ